MGRLSIFFVYVLFIAFVQGVQLFREDSPVQVDRVLVLRLRHVLSVLVTIVIELVYVVLVEVWIAASIVALWVLLVFCSSKFLGLLMSFMIYL